MCILMEFTSLGLTEHNGQEVILTPTVLSSANSVTYSHKIAFKSKADHLRMHAFSYVWSLLVM